MKMDVWNGVVMGYTDNKEVEGMWIKKGMIFWGSKKVGNRLLLYFSGVPSSLLIVVLLNLLKNPGGRYFGFNFFSFTKCYTHFFPL